MSDPTLQAQIVAANTYESLFVSALFGQWASKVADAAHLRPGERVLDVARGTGFLRGKSPRESDPWAVSQGLTRIPE